MKLITLVQYAFPENSKYIYTRPPSFHSYNIKTDVGCAYTHKVNLNTIYSLLTKLILIHTHFCKLYRSRNILTYFLLLGITRG